MNGSYYDDFGQHIAPWLTQALTNKLDSTLGVWKAMLGLRIVEDCLSYPPDSSKSKLLFSSFNLFYFMNFKNPIHQTFTASWSACSLHNPAAAIKPVPHPKHATTSRPCIRQSVTQVIDDNLRWKQEVPAGSPLKIKDLSCYSLETYTSTLLPPMVHVGMVLFWCICRQFSHNFFSIFSLVHLFLLWTTYLE